MKGREQLTNIQKILEPQTLVGSAQQWTMRNGFFIQALFDEYLSSFTWTAIYQAHQSQNPNAEQWESVQYADSIIRQTFGANDPSDISDVERGSPAMKIATMFMSWSNSQFQLLGNRWYTDVTRATGATGKAKGIAFTLALGIVLPSIINELITAAGQGGQGDDDKDNMLIDDWAWRFLAVGPGRYTAAVIPLAGNVMSKAVNAWNDNPADDRLNLSPIVSSAESILKAGPSTIAAFEGKDRPSNAIRNVSELLGMLTGLPFKAAAKPIGAIADVMADKSVAYQRAGATGVVTQALTGSVPKKN
jgi:hypothetical protein